MKMCDFASLTRKMFELLADIKAGRFVYVIARKAAEGRNVSIEDIICEETSNPRLALERHCKASGISMGECLCMPVILPPGLPAEDVRGFRSIRTNKALWFEYTGTK